MIECEVINIFWTNIYNWLYSKIEINDIPNPEDIIFGIDDPDLTIFNIVYISECLQNRNFPNIKDFDIYLQEIRKTEQSIAKRNDEYRQSNNTWSKLAN